MIAAGTLCAPGVPKKKAKPRHKESRGEAALPHGRGFAGWQAWSRKLPVNFLSTSTERDYAFV